MTGRPPIPSNILRLYKGELYDQQRDREANTPQPLVKVTPKCPKHFSKAERKEWKYFARILETYGLFSVANAPVLEMLAVNMAQYKDCQEKVSRMGVMVKSPSGFPVYNPYWNASNKLYGTIRKCLTDLGLSSVGLARLGSLTVKTKKQEEEGLPLD